MYVDIYIYIMKKQQLNPDRFMEIERIHSNYIINLFSL